MASGSWRARIRGSVRKAFAGQDGAVLSQHRLAGDRARNAREWIKAAQHYADHLDSHPGDFGIWIQRGNCLKDASRFDDALSAYRSALTIDDTSADLHLQIGHLMKLMKRPGEAVAAYRTSLTHNSLHNPAFEELLHLGALEEAQAVFQDKAGSLAAASEPVIYLDFTDLVVYLKHNDSLSGIQRVVANLITHAGSFMAGGGGKPRARIVPVLPDYHHFMVSAVSLDLLLGLLSAAQLRKGRSLIDAALDLVERSKTRVQLNKGDTFVIAGAFWIYQRYDLLNVLRLSGVNVTIYVHDLIQITNPEYVARDATNDFRRSIVDVLSVASYILTNSEFVAQEVRTYMRERLTFTIPVEAVTLATELGEASPDTGGRDELLSVSKTEYVLVVSTIEVRKNHRYAIDIWERLIAEGTVAVPNLVFVGKWGWQVADLQAYLDDSDYLGGRLYIFNGISDGELAALYQNCLFTLYPSFAEGWGLPVGESLGYGRPCIASKATAIPEVGGAFCRYVDPNDVEEGYKAVLKVLTDREDLQRWTDQIRHDFRAKTWDAFARQLFETVMRYAGQGTSTRNNVVLGPGEVADFGNAAMTQIGSQAAPVSTARMTRTSGWHSCDAWGCWAARRRAELLIATPSSPGTAIVLYLLMTAPDQEASADCIIEIGANRTLVDKLGSVPRWCAASGHVSDDGCIRVVLIAGRGYSGLKDGVERYAGVISVAYVPHHDQAGRRRLINAVMPGALLDEPLTM